MRITSFLLASCICVVPCLAIAGPCSDQIAELSRVTSGGGAPTTTGAVATPPASAGAAKPGEASASGTGKQAADQRSGTREMNAAAGQAATSPEDVRRQQQGQPTTAQAADRASERMPMAKAKLEQARLLDERGDAGCMTLVNEAREAMKAE